MLSYIVGVFLAFLPAEWNALKQLTHEAMLLSAKDRAGVVLFVEPRALGLLL